MVVHGQFQVCSARISEAGFEADSTLPAQHDHFLVSYMIPIMTHWIGAELTADS